MSVIQNPILRGFNPDPAIIRVGRDYYIATSTFEWFPGVQIHHSTDLKHWKLIAHPLRRASQLDLKGVPDSCGVWAPCLTYSDGVFYLVYSNVKSFDGRWKDTPNFLVTTTDITGEWSDPIYLSSMGFDGALFHDDDGRKWYTSMRVNHHQDDFFGGIMLQEYDPTQQRLVGDVYHLTDGTSLGKTEGPRIYKKDGYYYMLLAEGGTEYGHAVTVMRASTVTGPYEPNPLNPMITSRDNADLTLQKAGHASMVEAQGGQWYTVFLVGRPLSPLGRCILGRETAIEEIEWKDGWPRLKGGGASPRAEIPATQYERTWTPIGHTRTTFRASTLEPHFQSLRVPMTEDWCSLESRPGFLRLRGRESLSSTHNQSLVARRVQSYTMEAATCLEFEPESFQQMAGLVLYYNTGHFHYLYVSASKDGSAKELRVISCDNFCMYEQEEIVVLQQNQTILLKAVLDRGQLSFFYGYEEDSYQKIGSTLDASILSDDYIRDGSARYRPAFTGCFVGMCCQDLAQNQKCADFGWFEYIEKE